MFNSLLKGSIVLIMIFVIALSLAFIYAYEEISLDADKLINYKPQISSTIYDRDGNKLAYIFKRQHRLYAQYNEIPGFMIEALIAMEDTRFFEHNGVNIDAIMRAVIKDIKFGGFIEGGSTITQQLIKNKILSSEKKLARKIKEAILAIKIEHELSKEDIIERYLNEISYGNNYFGVKTASNGYFHKELSELTKKEIALLIGLPNAPSFYNPLRHYKRALDRANNVLYRMQNLGWITNEEYLKAVKESPTVYKTSLKQNIAPQIVNEVLRQFKGKLGDIRTGGYKIYTTIDMKQQKIAKEAVSLGYKKIVKRYKENPKTSTINMAFVSVESKTGDILAMVGTTDYKKSVFNRVTQSTRQPGSVFKPFIYQTALDMGYNPATPLTDLARTFQYYYKGKPRIWSPKNYERNYKGFISLRESLVHSRNLATINLVADLGLETIRQRLEFLDVSHIPRDMSIALGNLGLTPLKMAQIFSIFANKGNMIEPRLVTKIISNQGTIIYETYPKEIEGFTTPAQAYLMTDILKDVIKRGTGKNAKVKGIELAGKTGTTNNNVDAWFCGYSPTIETIIWVGRDNNKPIGKGATGGSLSAPIFASFYKKLLKIYPNIKRKFDIPDGIYKGEYEGKTELYSVDSPLPNNIVAQEENLNKSMIDIDIIENLNPNYNDIGYADTVKVDEDPPYEDVVNNPLHPKRKVPIRAVSEDSGLMF